MIYFFPKGNPPKVPAIDFNKDTGFPLRIYVRKSDLKFVEGYADVEPRVLISRRATPAAI